MSFPRCSHGTCKRQLITDECHPEYDKDQYFANGKLKSLCSVCRAKSKHMQRQKRCTQERERTRDLNAAEAFRQLLLENPEAFEIPEHQDQQFPTPLSDESENEDGFRLTFPDEDDDAEDSVGGGFDEENDEPSYEEPDLSGVYDAEEHRLFYILDVNSFKDINAAFLREAEEKGAREGICSEEFKTACAKCWDLIYWIVENQGRDLEDPCILEASDIYNDRDCHPLALEDMPRSSYREQMAPEPEIYYQQPVIDLIDNRSMRSFASNDSIALSDRFVNGRKHILWFHKLLSNIASMSVRFWLMIGDIAEALYGMGYFYGFVFAAIIISIVFPSQVSFVLGNIFGILHKVFDGNSIMAAKEF